MTAAGDAILGFHAHVYYRDPAQREVAARVRAGVEAQFDVKVGRWHDQPVGPHPIGMFQLAFVAAEFPHLVPWLMLHREGLAVLVHPETGRPRDDHLKHAMWMGEVLKLDGSVLPEVG